MRETSPRAPLKVQHMQWKIPQCVGFAAWRNDRDACSAPRKTDSSIEVLRDGDIRQKASRHDALPQLVRKLRLISKQAIHAAYIERIGSGVDSRHTRCAARTCTRSYEGLSVP